MKKFYQSLLMCMALMLSLTATAAEPFSVTFVIDEPDLVQVCSREFGDEEMIYTPYEASEDGVHISFDTWWGTVYINGVSGIKYDISRVKAGQTLEDAIPVASGKSGVYPLSIMNNDSDPKDGDTYYIYTSSAAPDSKITVNFEGDLSKIEGFCVGKTKYSLVEGTQEFEYNSVLDSFAALVLPDGGPRAIYSVLYDGVKIEPTTLMGDFFQYTFSNLASAKEHVVDIQTEYPDIYYDFTIKCPDMYDDFIKSVTVDGEAVADYSKVRAGSLVYFQGDAETYEVLSCTLNGNSIPFTRAWSGIVEGDMEFIFDLKPYEFYRVHIYVDNAQAIRARYYDRDLSLSDGDNDVYISSGSNLIIFEATEGNKITSMLYDGQELDASSNWKVADMHNGSHISITTGPLEDITFMVYADAEGAGGKMSADDVNYTTIKQGYNTMTCREDQNYYSMEYSSQPVAYLNNEYLKASTYQPDYSYWMFRLYAGDVLKVYGSEPEFYTVEYEFSGEGEQPFSVTADRVRNFDLDDTCTHSELPGTEMWIEESPLYKVVAINGEEPVAQDGKYIFTVGANTKVSVEYAADAIAILGADKNADKVYNLQGMQIGTRQDLNTLPAGIYIIAGRKVLVK